jgi:hypothetical protein
VVVEAALHKTLLGMLAALAVAVVVEIVQLQVEQERLDKEITVAVVI